MVMAVGTVVSLLESLIQKARGLGWLVYQHNLEWCEGDNYGQIVEFIASLGSATWLTCLLIPMHGGRVLLGVPCSADPDVTCHLQRMLDIDREVLFMLLEELGLHEHAVDRTSFVTQFAIDAETDEGGVDCREVTHRWRVADQSTWEECFSDALE